MGSIKRALTSLVWVQPDYRYQFDVESAAPTAGLRLFALDIAKGIVLPPPDVKIIVDETNRTVRVGNRVGTMGPIGSSVTLTWSAPIDTWTAEVPSNVNAKPDVFAWRNTLTGPDSVIQFFLTDAHGVTTRVHYILPDKQQGGSSQTSNFRFSRPRPDNVYTGMYGASDWNGKIERTGDQYRFAFTVTQTNVDPVPGAWFVHSVDADTLVGAEMWWFIVGSVVICVMLILLVLYLKRYKNGRGQQYPRVG